MNDQTAPKAGTRFAARPVAMTPRARLLIVDDEVNARTALAELLRDEGYSVETAAGGSSRC